MISESQPLNAFSNSVHSVHSVHSDEFMEFDELLAKLGDDDQIVNEVNEVNPNEVSKYDDNNDNNDNLKVISEDNRPDEIATEKVEIEIEVEGEGEEKRSEVKCGVVTNPDEFFEDEDGEEDNDGLISGLNRYV